MSEPGLLERVWTRLLFVIGRGRVALVDDAGDVQYVQVRLSPLETPNLRRLAEFGVASNPPAGSDAMVVFVAGDRANGTVIATGHQATRPRGLQPGESQLYNAFGMKVYLGKDGIVIDGGGKPVIVQNAPQVNINGAQTMTVQASTKVRFETPRLEVTGDIIDNVGGLTPNTDTLAGMRIVYNGHNHNISGIQTGLDTVTSDPPNEAE